jgi:hypothetical protein
MVPRKKKTFRNFAAGLILCICLLWIRSTYVLFRNLPNKADNNGVHNPRHGIPIIRMKQLQKQQRQDSPYTIVHSLTTRFMLGQKGKPILARARYLLFETFCQPTVRYQTALEAAAVEGGYEFSWFILADPGLDKEIIDDLKALLSSTSSSSQDTNNDSRHSGFPEGNAYLILTDNPSWAADGVGVPGVTSYGAGFEEIARGVRDGSVQLLTGNATKLIRTLEEDIEDQKKPAKQKHGNDEIKNNKPLLLIETMLDADDGLNNRAIEWIQDLAVSHTRQQQKIRNFSNDNDNDNDNDNVNIAPPTLNSTWWLLCGTDHIEWHNRDIYRLTEKQYQQKGGLSSGIIGLRHAPQYCASAGFTRVGLTTERSKSTPNSQALPLMFPQVAYSNHALATEEFDRCSEGSGIDNNNNNAINTTTLLSRCFRRDFEGVPFVLKGRTITSDSMDHMGVRNEDYRDLPWESKDDHPLLGLDESDKMWGIATKDFSIDRNEAQKTSIYLREHLESILQENRDSRCAPGFPCREVADVAFKKMTKYVGALKKINKQQQQQH